MQITKINSMMSLRDFISDKAQKIIKYKLLFQLIKVIITLLGQIHTLLALIKYPKN